MVSNGVVRVVGTVMHLVGSPPGVIEREREFNVNKFTFSGTINHLLLSATNVKLHSVQAGGVGVLISIRAESHHLVVEGDLSLMEDMGLESENRVGFSNRMETGIKGVVQEPPSSGSKLASGVGLETFRKGNSVELFPPVRLSHDRHIHHHLLLSRHLLSPHLSNTVCSNLLRPLCPHLSNTTIQLALQPMFLPPGRGHHVLVSHVLVFLSRQHVVGGVAEGFNELSAGGGVGSLQAGDRTWGGLYAISFLIVGTQRTRDALDMVVVFHRLLRVGDVARRARSTVYLSVVIREEVSSFFRADSGMDEVVGPGPLIVRAMRVPHHIITVVASSHQLTHLRPRQTEHVVRTRRTLRRPLGALGVGLARITVSLSLLSLEVTSIARGLSTGSRSNSENADEVNNSVVSTSIGGADRTINKSPLEGVTSRGEFFSVDSIAVVSSVGVDVLLHTINSELEPSNVSVVITVKVRGINLVAKLNKSRYHQKDISRKFSVIGARTNKITQNFPRITRVEVRHGFFSEFIDNNSTTNSEITSRGVNTLIFHGGKVGSRFTSFGVRVAGHGCGSRGIITITTVREILGDVDNILEASKTLSVHRLVVFRGTERASIG
jgi:hypothetical protein